MKNSKENIENYTFVLNKKKYSINDLEILATLGTGTFGRVRQCKFKKDKKEKVYALKMLKKSEIIKLNQLDHIKSEKKILSLISHPFIIKYKTSFSDKKYVYMILEYVQGGELFTKLRKEGRFSNDVTLFYISEILLALSFLHLAGIVYRDLKPENLLISSQGHMKLADFGFAKLMEKDKTYTLCGTPEYLAPEIIKGQKTGYGKSVDWWAVGILIFEMLAGYPPFYDCKPIGIYKKIINGIIEFPRFFTLRQKDIIRKLLNPDIRYRLGINNNGKEIMEHKWFRGVNFKKILEKKIKPPWVPKLKNQSDKNYFKNYSESREEAVSLSDSKNEIFNNF